MKKIYSSRYAVRGIRRDCCCCCYSCYVPPVNRVLPHCKLTLVLLLYRGPRGNTVCHKSTASHVDEWFCLGEHELQCRHDIHKNRDDSRLFIPRWLVDACWGAVMPVSTGVPGVKMSVNVSDALFGGYEWGNTEKATQSLFVPGTK